MAFRDVVNQDHAVLLLRTAIRVDKVGHAYLLVGPAGVGRRALAMAFAQLVNCDRPDGDACGECGPCRKIAAGNHPDVRVLDIAHAKFLETPGKEYKGKEIPIDQIRALRHDAAFPPYEGKRKVYIIADAELMNPSAGNSLLKVLEEPTARVTFVLISQSSCALRAYRRVERGAAADHCVAMPARPLHVSARRGHRARAGRPPRDLTGARACAVGARRRTARPGAGVGGIGA